MGKWRNQKDIPTPKTEVGKTKSTFRYLSVLGKYIVSRVSSCFPKRWPLIYPNLTKNMKKVKVCDDQEVY